MWCKDSKQKLIDLFSFHLLQERVLVKHALNDGDDDTMIVQQASKEATEKNIVVHCIVTAVFIAVFIYFMMMISRLIEW